MGGGRQDPAVVEAHCPRCLDRRLPQVGQQPSSDGACQHQLASGSRSDGLEQLLARPILEQRTRRSRLQGAHDVAVGIVGREELDLDGRSVALIRSMAATPSIHGMRRSIKTILGSACEPDDP